MTKEARNPNYRNARILLPQAEDLCVFSNRILLFATPPQFSSVSIRNQDSPSTRPSPLGTGHYQEVVLLDRPHCLHAKMALLSRRTSENSPAFQRRVDAKSLESRRTPEPAYAQNEVAAGRSNLTPSFSRPSDLCATRLFPALKRRMCLAHGGHNTYGVKVRIRGRSSVWSAPTCWRFCSRHGQIRTELACARGRQRDNRRTPNAGATANSRVWADARSVRRAKQVQNAGYLRCPPERGTWRLRFRQASNPIHSDAFNGISKPHVQ